MNSREYILARVRANQPPATALPAVPVFDADRSASLQTFKASLERMGGRFAECFSRANPQEVLDGLFPDARVIVSAAPEIAGTRLMSQIRIAAQLGDVDVGVVRARFAVAETGSVALAQSDFGFSALGFLPQHLVVLLDARDIVANLHHAYRNKDFFDAGYAVFMTGPSATADIEGVLIRGAQGVRSLTVIPWPRWARAFDKSQKRFRSNP